MSDPAPKPQKARAHYNEDGKLIGVDVRLEPGDETFEFTTVEVMVVPVRVSTCQAWACPDHHGKGRCRCWEHLPDRPCKGCARPYRDHGATGESDGQ